MTSHLSAISLSEEKRYEPDDCLCSGGSFTIVFMPRPSAHLIRTEPTLPAPITPRVISDKDLVSPRYVLMAESTHCATAGALHPGALATVMPREAQ